MANESIEKAYELGKKYEKVYRGCSQCVLAALQDTFGIKNDDVFKAATGLAAGGGACIDGSCGAYSGAVMFLSMLRGRRRDDFANSSGAMMKNFDLVRKLHEKFIDEYGSVVCGNIHTSVFGRPYYLADPDEFEKFEKAGAHETHCPEVVGKAARWAAEIVANEGLIQGKN